VDVLAIIGVVLTAASMAGAVYGLLAKKIDRLEDRVAKLEGDNRVQDVKLQNIDGNIHKDVEALTKAVDALARDLKAHMETEASQLRDILRAELAFMMPHHRPGPTPPGGSRRPGSGADWE
jgi:hypothetical protein